MGAILKDRDIEVEIIPEAAPADANVPFITSGHGLAHDALADCAVRLQSRSDGLHLIFFSDPGWKRPFVLVQSDESRFVKNRLTADSPWLELYHGAVYEALVRTELFWQAEAVELRHPAAGRWTDPVVLASLSALIDYIHDRPTHLRRCFLSPCSCSTFADGAIQPSVDLLQKEKRLSGRVRRDLLTEESAGDPGGGAFFSRGIRIDL